MAKKHRVNITASAEADILAIRAYIAEENLQAANRWVDRVKESF